MRKNSGIGILVLIILVIAATYLAVQYAPRSCGTNSGGSGGGSYSRPSDSSSGGTSDTTSDSSSSADELFNITVPSNDVYTVSGDMSVKKGDTALVNIVPVEGYELTVKNGDEILTANNNQYKIENVSADITLTVEVGYKTYKITYMSIGSKYVAEIDMMSSVCRSGMFEKKGAYYPLSYTIANKPKAKIVLGVFSCSSKCNGIGSLGQQLLGIYWDREKTKEFDGTIPEDTVGDITLWVDYVCNNTHNY